MTRERALKEVQLCDELLDLATPDLYRNNLFRVLGVRVNAGPMEVRQRQKRIEMQRKLGLSDASDAGGFFPLVPPPSPETAAKALERMNDPVARFLDEFFWFWGSEEDAGLAALGRGDVAGAGGLWKRASVEDSHARHNLAVLEHLVAIEQDSKCDSCGVAACADWKGLLSDEVFWDQARARVGAINDVRLTTGYVRRIRETLPRMLLLIFARQAVAASEQGNAKMVAALLKVIRSSGFDSEAADEAVREALKPLRNRISAAVASAKGRRAKTPQYGDKVVCELHETVAPLLVIYDRVAESALARQGVHDEVGEEMNLAEIAYCTATNNWSKGEKLLAIAQGIARGQRLRDQIAENIRIDQENAKSGNDWCAPGYWDLDPEVVARLEKAREHAVAGNFDAALRILLKMDKRTGYPLTRAVAYCLSVRAIRANNAALGDYNGESGIIKRIIDKLPDRWSLPTPETPSYLMPPCLACGTTSYTSWASLTYKEMRIFMCASCSSKHDQELERKKRALVSALQEPLDYLALAARLDPKDPAIKRNLEVISKMSREDGGSGVGNADALAEKLTVSRERRVTVPQVGVFTDTCFFCEQRAGDKASALFVVMYSPQIRTEHILGSSSEYRYGEVIVPRCPACRQHHVDWPAQIEAWHETALREADPARFPHAMAAEAKAREMEEVFTNGLLLAGQSVERAEAAIKRAIESQGFFARLTCRTNPACEAARKALMTAQEHHALAAARKQKAADVHARARSEMWALLEYAVATFKEATPQPMLPPGVKPEDCADAPGVFERRQQAWRIEVASCRGFVSRAPKLRELGAAVRYP